METAPDSKETLRIYEALTLSNLGKATSTRDLWGLLFDEVPAGAGAEARGDERRRLREERRREREADRAAAE